MQQPDDMVVVEGVEGHATRSARAHQSGSPQQPKLMGHRRLRHSDQVGQVAHTSLAMSQGVDEADPGGVAEQLEHFGDGLDDRGVQQARLNGGESGLVGVMPGFARRDLVDTGGRWQRWLRH